MKTEESFGAVPVFKDRDIYLFLAVQHRAGHWGFPKGHAEGSETAVEAARREFEEETGIKEYKLVENQLFFETYTYKLGNESIQKTVQYFIGISQTKDVMLEEKELSDYKWLPFEKTHELLTYDNAKKVLKEAQDYLKKL
jgi:8-oxo-dGTP pyrophosphatase MutT (NUDIX family)|tara:strand:- start:22740 stop:23159 length:420 start_codon:yes stop_codon:yes gene_type:complete